MKKMMKIGIMQGRFTNKGGFFPQSFPWVNWQKEFEIGEENQIDCIEWMFNYERYENNPLFTKDGTDEISNVITQTGVMVPSVCANYYMEKALCKDNELVVLETICRGMRRIGAKMLVVPLFGDNNPKNRNERTLLVYALKESERVCTKYGINLCIEADWKLKEIYDLLAEVEKLGICYDIGNSAGIGKETVKEVEALREKVVDVHVKDKSYKGASVMLGKGCADIKNTIRVLNDIGYAGNIILESYFDQDAICDTVTNLTYVRRCLG